MVKALLRLCHGVLDWEEMLWFTDKRNRASLRRSFTVHYSVEDLLGIVVTAYPVCASITSGTVVAFV